MKERDKVILTDCDGVLLNWEYAFITWMKRHGYSEVENGHVFIMILVNAMGFRRMKRTV